MQHRPMRLVLAIVGLLALALFILGMVQVASGITLSPALTVVIVLLGGLLVLIFRLAPALHRRAGRPVGRSAPLHVGCVSATCRLRVGEDGVVDHPGGRREHCLVVLLGDLTELPGDGVDDGGGG